MTDLAALQARALEAARDIAWKEGDCYYCMERDVECFDCEGVRALAALLVRFGLAQRAVGAEECRDKIQRDHDSFSKHVAGDGEPMLQGASNACHRIAARYRVQAEGLEP